MERINIILKLIYYQTRLIYSWGHSLFVVISIVIGLTMFPKNPALAYDSFYDMFEVLFPLFASLLFVNLILIEQQRRTLFLIGTTDVSLGMLFVLRFLLLTALVITILFIQSMLLAFNSGSLINALYEAKANPVLNTPVAIFEGYEQINSLWLILFTISVPIVFLAGIGTLVGHLAVDAKVGYMIIFSLWMINRAIGLTLNSHPFWRLFFLFPCSSGTEDWVSPKFFQLFLGILLLITSGLLLKYPERFLKRP